ncbi:MAG: hypothetical protein K8R54_03130 [Bacteroidales bacterium]|nr:hypothetical protein [Bacteroidales bacterium]
MENLLEQKANELFLLTEKFKTGKEGVDFMIEFDDGIAQYKETAIEDEFVKITRKIMELLKQNPDILTFSIYKKIKAAFDNSSVAKGSFRGRTPQGGGDWTDILSPVEWEINVIADFLKETAKKLKKDYHSEFVNVDDKIINDMF